MTADTPADISGVAPYGDTPPTPAELADEMEDAALSITDLDFPCMKLREGAAAVRTLTEQRDEAQRYGLIWRKAAEDRDERIDRLRHHVAALRSENADLRDENDAAQEDVLRLNDLCSKYRSAAETAEAERDAARAYAQDAEVGRKQWAEACEQRVAAARKVADSAVLGAAMSIAAAEERADTAEAQLAAATSIAMCSEPRDLDDPYDRGFARGYNVALANVQRAAVLGERPEPTTLTPPPARGKTAYTLQRHPYKPMPIPHGDSDWCEFTDAEGDICTKGAVNQVHECAHGILIHDGHESDDTAGYPHPRECLTCSCDDSESYVAFEICVACRDGSP